MVPAGLFMILNLLAWSRAGMLFQSSRNISVSSFTAGTKKTVQVKTEEQMMLIYNYEDISGIDGDQCRLRPPVPALCPVRCRGLQLLQSRRSVSPVPAGQPHLPGGPPGGRRWRRREVCDGGGWCCRLTEPRVPGWRALLPARPALCWGDGRLQYWPGLSGISQHITSP